MSMHKREGGRQSKRTRCGGRNKEALVYLTEMEITTEPMSEPGAGTASPEFQDEMEELHEKLRTSPGETIPRLEALTAKYPNIPSLGNWLMVAYNNTGQNEKANGLIEEQYRRLPDYFFARCNYASLCIQRGQFDEAKEVLGGQFLPTFMCPGRKRFHLSEIIAYLGVATEYLIQTNDLESAQECVRTLEELAPGHPQTQQISERLAMVLAVAGLQRMMGQRRRRGKKKRGGGRVDGRGGGG